MKVESIKIEEATPYENNPRENEEAAKAVGESIQRFGFLQPIVVDSEGVIIAGHTRLKAARRLGMQRIPAIRAEKLTPEQVAAYRLADNKTGELAAWDPAALAEELGEIETIDMAAFGFYEEEPEDEEPEEDPGEGDFVSLKFEYTVEEYETVKAAESQKRGRRAGKLLEIVREWEKQKISL